MTALPISAYIITLNEEKKIAAALECMKSFAEVIVVDSGSTDRTQQIAESFPNVKFSFNEWPGFSQQKSHALSLCTQNWVINVDADEILTEGLLNKIRSVIEKNTADALECSRILLRQGREPRSLDKKDRLIRCFKKEKGFYPPRRVHESISVDGKIEQTSESILHLEELTFSERVAKSNRYSQMSAEDKLDNGKRANALVVGLIFPVTFLKYYLLKGYFLDGVNGFLTSMNAAFYAFMKYAKLWEMREQTIESRVEKNPLIPALNEESRTEIA